MIKKFLLLILIFICFTIQNVFADVMKINDVTFDSSDSVIFIATSGSEESISIKKGLLSNPARMFFDINNAVLTKKQTSYDFKNGKLSNLKISQFSTSPNVVRVVMTFTDKLKPEKVKLLSVGGNIIIKLQDYKPAQDYLTSIYREVKSDAYDYLEKMQVSETVTMPATETIVLSPAEPKNQNIAPQNEPVRITPPIQESKLRSRYFVSNVYTKQEALLIAGMGIVNLEKTIYLSNPSRVVFDIPNTVSSSAIRTKTFRLSENETAKVGQFEPTKVRIVITTPEPEKYRAIYANDLQNILIAREDKLKNIKLYANTSSALKVTSSTKNEYKNSIDTLTIDFSEPTVFSLKRYKDYFEVELYNVLSKSIFNKTANFQKGCIKNTVLQSTGETGVKIKIPITSKTTIDCLENLKATKLVLKLKNPVQQTQLNISKKHLSGKTIVIDPGHGGSDPGAMRNDVKEKDIVLQISKYLEQELKKQGANVLVTRNDDTFISLNDRVVFSNTHKPDIFVSVHINASEKDAAHGIETHYYKDDSIDFAKQIHKSIIAKTNDFDRGILKSRFYVIRHTEQPAILLELGFISNERERQLMKTPERQKAFAEAIAEGIINYLNTETK